MLCCITACASAPPHHQTVKAAKAKALSSCWTDVQGSFYPGEEDMEDWYYGDQTQSAVLTFQVRLQLQEPDWRLKHHLQGLRQQLAK